MNPLLLVGVFFSGIIELVCFILSSDAVIAIGLGQVWSVSFHGAVRPTITPVQPAVVPFRFVPIILFSSCALLCSD